MDSPWTWHSLMHHLSPNPPHPTTRPHGSSSPSRRPPPLPIWPRRRSTTGARRSLASSCSSHRCSRYAWICLLRFETFMGTTLSGFHTNKIRNQFGFMQFAPLCKVYSAAPLTRIRWCGLFMDTQPNREMLFLKDKYLPRAERAGDTSSRFFSRNLTRHCLRLIIETAPVQMLIRITRPMRARTTPRRCPCSHACSAAPRSRPTPVSYYRFACCIF